MNYIFKIVVLLLCWNAVLLEISGESFTVDLFSDIKEDWSDWLTIKCPNNDTSYDNFWPYGCSNQLPEVGSGDPVRQDFWTRCSHNVPCEFIFYGRGIVSSVTVRGYIDGSSRVIVGGKKNPIATDYTEFGRIASPGNKMWTETKLNIPTGPNDDRVISMFLDTPDPDGLVLIDGFTVDFTVPTTPPDDENKSSQVAVASIQVLSFIASVTLLLNSF